VLGLRRRRDLAACGEHDGASALLEVVRGTIESTNESTIEQLAHAAPDLRDWFGRAPAVRAPDQRRDPCTEHDTCSHFKAASQADSGDSDDRQGRVFTAEADKSVRPVGARPRGIRRGFGERLRRGCRDRR